ncbi:MAG: hypothetical protein KAH01_03885 [Caldisericia bacterium]|nr:hypothetical protein [Caldisericia bacterium]
MENINETSNIRIKKISQKKDYTSCVNIQKQVTNLSSVGIIPAYFMEIINNRGGLVLGCFDEEKLVGFNFSFPCFSKKYGNYLFADSMGFLENYQRKTLGFKLKRHQYFSTKEKGIRYIIWTYDPLMGVNANINIRKLGGTVSNYISDKYDILKPKDFEEDKKATVIPGDRVELVWDLESKTVEERTFKERIPTATNEILNYPCATETAFNGEYRTITKSYSDLDFERIRVEIPLEYLDIEYNHPSDALNWRMKTRELFLNYFSSEYIIKDFFSVYIESEKRNFYILVKDKKLHAPSNTSH